MAVEPAFLAHVLFERAEAPVKAICCAGVSF
jgi:hypothetical protein